MNIEKEKRVKAINEDAFFLLIVAGIILVLFSFRTLSFTNGESMLPTLHNGDVAIVRYVDHAERGDIVLFRNVSEDGRELLIKRIIGIPGDHVQIQNGDVYVNNQKQDQSFTLDHFTEGEEDLILNKDEYYVLGDNRGDSIDSREAEVGVVSRSSIQGVATRVIFPFHRISNLNAGGNADVQ